MDPSEGQRLLGSFPCYSRIQFLPGGVWPRVGAAHEFDVQSLELTQYSNEV